MIIAPRYMTANAGRGSFAKAMVGLRRLASLGITVEVAGRFLSGDREEQLRDGFARTLRQAGITIDCLDPRQLVLFREMREDADRPEITPACWGILNVSPDGVMCSSARMVVRRRGSERPVVVACTLLAYDQRFELGATLADANKPLYLAHPHCAHCATDKQLQYTWLRALQGRHVDFWQVTGDALDFALETLAIDKPGLRHRLMQLYLTLDRFPEVPDTLATLKTAGLRTAILSNGSPNMLDAAVRDAGLDGLLDAVLSVEEVGVYKPHPAVYQLAVDRLSIAPNGIAFQSSNAWDAYAVSAFGMQVIWCNRYQQRTERLPGAPDRIIRTLAELPALVGAS